MSCGNRNLLMWQIISSEDLWGKINSKIGIAVLTPHWQFTPAKDLGQSLHKYSPRT